MIRAALPLVLILLAGCARSEPASFTPAENDSQALDALPTAEGEEDEVALGEWRAGLLVDQPTLEFGPAGAPPHFSLACDGRRNILLQRHGAVVEGDLPVMLVTVGSETRRLAVAATGGAIPMLRATLPANDQFRVVLAETSLPITVRIGDSPPLVLPPSPLIGNYATTCASSQIRPAGPTPAAESNTTASANAAAPAE